MDFRFRRGRITQLLNIGSGRMDAVFSPDADPGDHLGDWYQVEPQQCRLLVRQFFSDRAGEDLADLHLESPDPDTPPTRLDPIKTAAAFDEPAAEMSIVPKFWTDYAVSQRDRGEVNSFAHMADRSVSTHRLSAEERRQLQAERRRLALRRFTR